MAQSPRPHTARPSSEGPRRRHGQRSYASSTSHSSHFPDNDPAYASCWLDDVDTQSHSHANSKRINDDQRSLHHPSSHSAPASAFPGSSPPFQSYTSRSEASKTPPSNDDHSRHSARVTKMIGDRYAHQPSSSSSRSAGPSPTSSWRNGDISNRLFFPATTTTTPRSISSSNPTPRSITAPSSPHDLSPRRAARSASCSGVGSGSSSCGGGADSMKRVNSYRHPPPMPPFESPMPIDMKRLLSKPALPSQSGSETISIPSDSENHYYKRSRSQIHRRPSTVDDVRRGMMGFGRQAASDTPVSVSLSRKTSMSSLPGHSKERKPPKPQATLERKPSTSMPSTVPAESGTSMSRTLSVRSSAPAVPRSGETPKSGTRQDSRNTWRPHIPATIPLTPAGEVAHAYKTQEGKRVASASEATSSEEDDGRPKRTHPGKKFGLGGDAWMDTLVGAQGRRQQAEFSSSQRGEGRGEDDAWIDKLGSRRMGGQEAEFKHTQSNGVTVTAKSEEAAVPYYTVSGRLSGKVVAVGGPDDGWDLDADGYYSADERGDGRKFGARKVSGKWKKITGVVGKDGAGGDAWNGRTSLQDVRPIMGGRKRPPRLTTVNKAGDTESSPTGGVKHGLSERGKLVKSADRRHESTETSAGGGKIWKLVKRISSGGLRERAQIPSEEAPPPVPSVPQFIAGTNRSLPGSAVSPAKPTTGRPSTATRSSSPLSSEVGSRFFHKEQSTRSSTSSYGEEISSPAPRTLLGQHILPPHELQRLHREAESKAAMRPLHGPTNHSADWNNSNTQQPASLPVPPRRIPNIASKIIVGSPSPEPPSPPIPTFSTMEPVNNFQTLRDSSSSGDTRTALSPLNIGVEGTSPRSTRRRDGQSTPSPSPMCQPSDGSTRTSRTLRVSPAKDERSRSEHDCRTLNSHLSAHSDASTLRQRSNSYDAQPLSALSTLTFREMGQGPRPSLSEREKAARWEDLLERSEMAGGTLHLAGSGSELASDQISISNTSYMS